MQRLTRFFTMAIVLGGIAGPAALSAADKEQEPVKLTVQANSEFAVDLYRQLAKENQGENLFFSPYSVSNALMMTLEGARSETALQMGRLLGLPKEMLSVGGDAQQNPWNTSMVHTGLASLNDRLMGDKEGAEVQKIRARIAALRKQLAQAKQRIIKLQRGPYRELAEARKAERTIVLELNRELGKIDQYVIRVANALWGEKTYPFRKEYFDTVNNYYKTGGVFSVDFRKRFEDVRLRINGWVEDQTNKRIKNLIPQGALDDTTRLVLTNAIYFKGDWATPFEKKATQDRGFTLGDGTKVATPIMYAHLEDTRYAAFNADGSFFDTPVRRSFFSKETPKLYSDEGGFAMAELPYKGDTLSMVVLAPNNPKGFGALEAKMTSANLTKWLSQLKERETRVHLPRFKLETEYTLGDAGEPATLQKMGMVRAFVDPRDPKNGAQFQGMTTSTNPRDQLYITKVLHKAFVEVNEKGTEAAAATAVIVATPTSAPASVPFVPEFKADRPFVFLIRDTKTGSILFLGRVSNPKG